MEHKEAKQIAAVLQKAKVKGFIYQRYPTKNKFKVTKTNHLHSGIAIRHRILDVEALEGLLVKNGMSLDKINRIGILEDDDKDVVCDKIRKQCKVTLTIY